MWGSAYSAVFPEPAGAEGRGRQLEDTWTSLVSQLREPVDTTLRGGMSAGDIAYRLGELVHNYFRSRGATLTSFELRRIVVALLDNYRRGWPSLADPSTDMAAVFAGDAPAARQTDTLVVFDERNGSRRYPPAEGWGGEAPPAAAPSVVTPDLPSSLVSLAPRAEATLPPVGPPVPMAARAASAVLEASPAPVPPPAGPVSDAPAPPVVSTPVVSVDAALAAIMPILLQQRSSAPASRRERQDRVRGAVAAALVTAAITVSEAERDLLERQAYDELFGLGPLDAVMRDDTVRAVLVNGPGAVFVDRRGRLEPVRVAFRDAGQLERVAERLTQRVGGAVDAERGPVVDRRLDDGTRVTVVTPPLASGGPYLVIRRPVTRAVTLDSMVAEGVLSPQMAGFLRVAVRSRLNLLICGGPDCGKTALLAALARAAGTEDRVITIERSAELRPDVVHHVPLIVPGDIRVAPTEVLTAALALRPDRLLIDDVTEAVTSGIVGAVAAGTDGIMASVGAVTPQDALDRLYALLRAADAGTPPPEARRRLARAFEVVVYLERQRDGMRRVAHLADVTVADDAVASRDLFTFDKDAGRFVATGVQPGFLPRVGRAGLEKALRDVL
ncbi:CpaF family protein [Vineibacter terrae]|uniref:CpaF family protein n=1 Tax=Vineibacter terrae TaxID=2586908 RepID=A0A5C8PBS3_9HYPH|nr:ATPase, T2SS/T4P/T4SS family [Vineibacter terrae]TXL70898.1 CpaF family protein [Vineibacter terrae]